MTSPISDIRPISFMHEFLKFSKNRYITLCQNTKQTAMLEYRKDEKLSIRFM